MQYEIIATLGPSSERAETWRGMLAAGTTAFRLNTSHLSLVKLSGWLERLLGFFEEYGKSVPLVLDLQGSKWRLGDLPAAQLALGQKVELFMGRSTGRAGALPVPHVDFFAAAPGSDGEIVLNDARARLVIEEIREGAITARVTQAGPIETNKGITFQNYEYRNESLSDKDRAVFERTRGLPGMQYAISYIKDGQEMANYRRAFGAGSRLIAKLERGPAMADAVDIARSANELWVCRGDLGAELGLAGMAEAVHAFSTQVKDLLVPTIMAGQVLEHLTEHPMPTRSEVCYLYDRLKLGYRGFVLSDETAVGKNPVEACMYAGLFL